MSETTAADVINAVPGIMEKRYLELGVAGRATFDNVLAPAKIGVDIEGGEPLLKMTTDVFFRDYAKDYVYDVIYIDADHTYERVVKDYNNSIKHLAPGGLILLHDMVPPDESYTAPIWCGDAYKLLIGILRNNDDLLVLDHNYGLTVVRNPKSVNPDGAWAHLTYDEFASTGIHRSTGEEMLAFVART